MLVFMDGKVGEFTDESRCEAFEVINDREPTAIELELAQRKPILTDQLCEEFNHSKRTTIASASGSAAMHATVHRS